MRQRKIIAMRFGKITDLAEQSRNYQAFMLKEYSEAMWRLRRPDSSFSGYIPFGQYTWFFDPFDQDKIRPKHIWNTYKKVMSPVHVQFECFSRHILWGECIQGVLGLWNEDVHLKTDNFTVNICIEGRRIDSRTYHVEYHKAQKEQIEIGPLEKSGRIIFEVFAEDKKIAYNDIEITVYERAEYKAGTETFIYDPENITAVNGQRINSLSELNDECKLLLVGPYAIDRNTVRESERVLNWVKEGGKLIVLEQNPSCYTTDMFGTGISSLRVCQPQWSRWAMNLVKHADRTDICCEHRMFKGLTERDLNWWNEDTFVADSYLSAEITDADTIISQVGNGLASTELMPVEYHYENSGSSITAIERRIGRGSALFTSLLVGSKSKIEPVAATIIRNLLDF